MKVDNANSKSISPCQSSIVASDTGSRHTSRLAVNCIATSDCHRVCFQEQCIKHQPNDRSVLDYLPTNHNAASPSNYPPRRARRFDTVVLAAFSSLASSSLPELYTTNNSSCLPETWALVRFHARLTINLSKYSNKYVLMLISPSEKTHYIKRRPRPNQNPLSHRPCPQ